jgi:hypothetical protein
VVVCSVGVVNELPVNTCVAKAASLYQIALKPVVQPVTVKVALVPAHTVAGVPCGVGGVQSQVNTVTATVSLQPAAELYTKLYVPVAVIPDTAPAAVTVATAGVVPICAQVPPAGVPAKVAVLTGEPATQAKLWSEPALGLGFTVAVTFTPALLQVVAPSFTQAT